MMHIFINALGASAASGLTYLRNVLPLLAIRQDVQASVAAIPQVRAEFREFRATQFVDLSNLNGTANRFWFEQRRIPVILRELQVDVLISAGNFAVRSSPVPQILLSGNSLYTSGDFYRDLLARREYGMWIDTRLKAWFAKKSISWADRTVAPSRAFAEELRRWTGKDVHAVHHGFDRGIFFADQTPLSDETRLHLNAAGSALKLLYVSHYNYFRNFETLFRALPFVREKRRVRLFLTCKLEAGANPGSYQTESARLLLRQLGIEDEVIELGAVPYRQLHQLYRACDVYVTASYAETFSHPLVEAMACGLPIVASDLRVHREVCGGAARYFPTFSPSELGRAILETAEKRSPQVHLPPFHFSWRDHVDQLLALSRSLVARRLAAAAQAQEKGEAGVCTI